MRNAGKGSVQSFCAAAVLEKKERARKISNSELNMAHVRCVIRLISGLNAARNNSVQRRVRQIKMVVAHDSIKNYHAWMIRVGLINLACRDANSN
jgi:hypothetical protein